ncbi:hypothetical protein RHMOL_Rhmol02G0165000 [Rhododendron molle]|uniref:Uncharacterized protein n=1 Tax=Rhododendron molle TaxID=49168 RepID=A0ACC0PQJ9_RHOML|nr:hypothetical protein RHMOL_Rhmol02G0165000 [Rhododendron molle]
MVRHGKSQRVIVPPAMVVNEFMRGTDCLASVPDFTENQEKTQNPEGEQFYPEENPEVEVEPEYTWDPYQA